MKILRLLSTKSRRVLHCTTEALLYGDDDPCLMNWYTIELKLFGIKWIKVEEYTSFFYLKAGNKNEA